MAVSTHAQVMQHPMFYIRYVTLQVPSPNDSWVVPDEAPPNLPKLQLDLSVSTLPLFPHDTSPHGQDNSAFNAFFKRLQECTSDRRKFALRNALDCVVAVIIASDDKEEVDRLRTLVQEACEGNVRTDTSTSLERDNWGNPMKCYTLKPTDPPEVVICANGLFRLKGTAITHVIGYGTLQGHGLTRLAYCSLLKRYATLVNNSLGGTTAEVAPRRLVLVESTRRAGVVADLRAFCTQEGIEQPPELLQPPPEASPFAIPSGVGRQGRSGRRTSSPVRSVLDDSFMDFDTDLGNPSRVRLTTQQVQSIAEYAARSNGIYELMYLPLPAGAQLNRSALICILDKSLSLARAKVREDISAQEQGGHTSAELVRAANKAREDIASERDSLQASLSDVRQEKQDAQDDLERERARHKNELETVKKELKGWKKDFFQKCDEFTRYKEKERKREEADLPDIPGEEEAHDEVVIIEDKDSGSARGKGSEGSKRTTREGSEKKEEAQGTPAKKPKGERPSSKESRKERAARRGNEARTPAPEDRSRSRSSGGKRERSPDRDDEDDKPLERGRTSGKKPVKGNKRSQSESGSRPTAQLPKGPQAALSKDPSTFQGSVPRVAAQGGGKPGKQTFEEALAGEEKEAVKDDAKITVVRNSKVAGPNKEMREKRKALREGETKLVKGVDNPFTQFTAKERQERASNAETMSAAVIPPASIKLPCGASSRAQRQVSDAIEVHRLLTARFGDIDTYTVHVINLEDALPVGSRELDMQRASMKRFGEVKDQNYYWGILPLQYELRRKVGPNTKEAKEVCIPTTHGLALSTLRQEIFIFVYATALSLVLHQDLFLVLTRKCNLLVGPHAQHVVDILEWDAIVEVGLMNRRRYIDTVSGFARHLDAKVREQFYKELPLDWSQADIACIDAYRFLGIDQNFSLWRKVLKEQASGNRVHRACHADMHKNHVFKNFRGARDYYALGTGGSATGPVAGYLQGVYEPLCAQGKISPKCELDNTPKLIGAFLSWLQATYDDVAENAIPLETQLYYLDEKLDFLYERKDDYVVRGSGETTSGLQVVFSDAMALRQEDGRVSPPLMGEFCGIIGLQAQGPTNVIRGGSALFHLMSRAKGVTLKEWDDNRGSERAWKALWEKAGKSMDGKVAVMCFMLEDVPVNLVAEFGQNGVRVTVHNFKESQSACDMAVGQFRQVVAEGDIKENRERPVKKAAGVSSCEKKSNKVDAQILAICGLFYLTREPEYPPPHLRDLGLTMFSLRARLHNTLMWMEIDLPRARQSLEPVSEEPKPVEVQGPSTKGEDKKSAGVRFLPSPKKDAASEGHAGGEQSAPAKQAQALPAHKQRLKEAEDFFQEGAFSSSDEEEPRPKSPPLRLEESDFDTRSAEGRADATLEKMEEALGDFGGIDKGSKGQAAEGAEAKGEKGAGGAPDTGAPHLETVVVIDKDTAALTTHALEALGDALKRAIPIPPTGEDQRAKEEEEAKQPGGASVGDKGGEEMKSAHEGGAEKDKK